MAQKIDAAVNHGVDTFIFDWYMYEDGPFLNRCLDEGFLKAENTEKINFGLMWANHDWVDIHPYVKGEEQRLEQTIINFKTGQYRTVHDSTGCKLKRPSIFLHHGNGSFFN